MKRLLIFSCLLCVWVGSWAQQDRFLFIQHSSRQAFYARMGETSFSSSAGGHLLLARLADSTYSLFIGFPKSRYPEQLYRIVIDKKDRGFELRNVDGRWVLTDVLTMEVLQPVATASNGFSEQVKREDSYSKLMAEVVDDTAVLYMAAAAPVVVEEDSVSAPVVKQSKGKKSKAQAGVNGKDSAARQLADAKKQQAAAKAVAKKVDTVEQKGDDVEKPEPEAEMLTGQGDTVEEKKTDQKKSGAEAETVAKKPDTAKAKKADVKRREGEAETVAQKGESGGKAEEGRSAVADTAAENKAVINYSSVPGPIIDKRDIIRFSTENTDQGKLMIYLDRTRPVIDTIRILIPRL